MPSTYEVEIVVTQPGQPASFSPANLACNVGDAIFWRNRTSDQYQLLQWVDGQPVADPPMTLPIPSGGTSSVFSPGANTPPTEPYRLIYGIKDSRVTGIITVNPQA